jgi:hypothetical protein
MAAQFNGNSLLTAEGQWEEVKRNHYAPIKANGLYPLLETLMTENNPIVATHPFSKHNIQNESGCYYLSKFSEQPSQKLFENYSCIERHLRIDEDYSDSRNRLGLSPAHFSEYWIHQTNERIIVHVYYLDRIQTVQARTDVGVLVPLTEQLIQKIKRNTAVGFELYKELLEERDRRLKKIIEDSDNLLDTLTSLSVDLSSSSNQKKYLKIGRTFVKIVEVINQYAGGNFPRDKRGDFIAKRITQIEAYQRKITIPAFQEPIVEEEPVLPILVKDIKKPSLAKLKVQEIQGLVECLERQKSSDWTIESYQIADRLKIELFDLAFINAPGALREPLVKRASTILVLLPEPCALAKVMASAGELESFKILLPMMSQSSTCNLYMDLLKNLLDLEKDEDQEANSLRTVCEYLFENNKLYRVMIRLPFLLKINEDLAVSLLCKAFVRQKLSTFKMMLRHGCDSNQIAYKNNTQCYSLLKAMAVFNPEKIVPIDYFNCLLEYGLEIDFFHQGTLNPIPITNFYQNIRSANASQTFKNIRSVMDSAVNVGVNPELFDLSFAINNQSWEMAQLLLPRSHLAAISLSLMSLANKGDQFANGRVVGKTPSEGGVLVFPTIEARAMALDADEENPDNMQSIRYMIARKTASNEAYQCMEELYQAFIREYKKCSKRQVAEHIQLLKNLAFGNKIAPEYQNRIYSACIALLIHPGKLDLVESQEVLELLWRIAINQTISQNIAFQAASTSCYKDMVSFAEKSRDHAKTLTNSRAYQVAIKALAPSVALLYQQGTIAASSTRNEQVVRKAQVSQASLT